MSKLQKHAALIHAWADGAEIEVLSTTGNWRNVPYPNWDNSTYRIKPQTKLDVAIEALEKFANYPCFSPITSEVAQEALNKIRSME